MAPDDEEVHDGAQEQDESRVTEPPSDRVHPITWLALAAVCALWSGSLLGSSLANQEGYSIGPLYVEDTPETRAAKTLAMAGLYALLFALVLPAMKRGQPVHESEEEPAPLCTACLQPYVEGAHFCPHCGAPLTWFASTAGYESIYAQAWCLGRAKHGPSQPIHLLGLGALLAVYVGYFLIFLLSATTSIFDSWGEIGLVGEFLTLLIYWLLFRGCLNNQDPEGPDKLDPDLLDPTREPYGSPPYWTYDRWWYWQRDDTEDKEEPEDDPPDSPPGFQPDFVPGP